VELVAVGLQSKPSRAAHVAGYYDALGVVPSERATARVREVTARQWLSVSDDVGSAGRVQAAAIAAVRCWITRVRMF